MTNHEPLPARIPGARVESVDEVLNADLTPAEAEALQAFFAEAAGPARPEELAGEAAALAAYRTAFRVPAPVPGRSWTKRSLATLFTVKAVVLGGISLGGVAIAATTGVLPTPLPEKAPATQQVDQRDDRAEQVDPNRPAAKAGSSGGVTADRQYAAFPGLCTAYAAADRADKVSNGKRFSRLILAAGGQEKVAAFCANLPLDASESGQDTTADAPGNAEAVDRGRPDSPGKSESAPGHAKADGPGAAPAEGKSADAGKPSDAGKPADAGKSADAPGHTKVAKGKSGVSPSAAR